MAILVLLMEFLFTLNITRNKEKRKFIGYWNLKKIYRVYLEKKFSKVSNFTRKGKQGVKNTLYSLLSHLCKRIKVVHGK
jgi:hypothetical protein